MTLNETIELIKKLIGANEFTIRFGGYLLDDAVFNENVSILHSIFVHHFSVLDEQTVLRALKSIKKTLSQTFNFNMKLKQSK